MKKFLLLTLAAVMAGQVMADNEWLHIYRNDKNFSNKKVAEIENITYKAGTDGTYTGMIVSGTDGKDISVNMSAVEKCVIGQNVPEIYITLTDYPTKTELWDKELYLNATVKVVGNGMCDDIDEWVTTIKGRGNSTWNMAKKPYRFKGSSKIKLLGLPKAKSFALIANYIDCSLMRNAIALWVAQRLGMPYTNHCKPARVYLNGVCKGAYMVTEKIGIGGGSVDIDENTGILFELDSNYDENYKFKFSWTESSGGGGWWGGSTSRQIPVQVKDPDIDEIAAATGTTASELWSKWQADFSAMANAVVTTASTGSLSDYIDLESAVNYFIVNNIAGNHEPKHPKSVYLYKGSDTDVYHFGPVWDFDWAYTYDGYEGAASPTSPLMAENGDYAGYSFFKKIFENQEFRALYKERWESFMTNDYPALLEYIEEYADIIEPSALENGLIWPATSGRSSSFDFRTNVATLKTWIGNRVNYISNDQNYGLYR